MIATGSSVSALSCLHICQLSHNSVGISLRQNSHSPQEISKLCWFSHNKRNNALGCSCSHLITKFSQVSILFTSACSLHMQHLSSFSTLWIASLHSCSSSQNTVGSPKKSTKKYSSKFNGEIKIILKDG